MVTIIVVAFSFVVSFPVRSLVWMITGNYYFGVLISDPLLGYALYMASAAVDLIIAYNIIVGVLIDDYLLRYRHNRRKDMNKLKESKTVNIVYEWYKAKKYRYCPLIEFI